MIPPALTDWSPPAPPDPDVGRTKFSDDPVEHTTLSATFMALILVTWLVFGHKIQAMFSWTKWISEGSMACMLGVLSGIMLLIWDMIHGNTSHKSLSFDSAIFFTYMLPPIIFYGGLAIKRKLFVSNLLSIVAFGILGTFVSFTLLLGSLNAVSLLPNVLSVQDSFSLAAIFAATDSVAVLQVLRPESHPALYSIVLGEGVMNDATSVALLRSVKHLDPDAALTVSTLLSTLTFFVYVFVASFALGLCFGLLIAATMKHLGPFSQPQEVSLVGAIAFLAYLIAELCGWSGILALFFCGMTVSHYALQHVSRPSQHALLNAFRTLSYLLEGFIFLYVGRDTLDPNKWANANFFETLYLVVVIAALVAFSRAAFVFPLAWMHNRWSSQPLSLNDSIVVWWAGMMRGAVSVAMVYYTFDPKNNTADKHSATLVVTTLQVVLYSTVGMGGLTGPLLKFLLDQQVCPPDVTGEQLCSEVQSDTSPSLSPLETALLGQSDLAGTGPNSPVDGRPHTLGLGARRISVGVSTPPASAAIEDGVGKRGHSSPRAEEHEGQAPAVSTALVTPAGIEMRPIASARLRSGQVDAGLGSARSGNGGTAMHSAEGTPGGESGRLAVADARGAGSRAAQAAEAPASVTKPLSAITRAARSLLDLSGTAGSGEDSGSRITDMGAKMMHAAQAVADATDFTGRGTSAPDGALGEKVYERFLQFDSKYLQPMFGREEIGKDGGTGKAVVVDVDGDPFRSGDQDSDSQGQGS